jgi:hypothetical protein
MLIKISQGTRKYFFPFETGFRLIEALLQRLIFWTLSRSKFITLDKVQNISHCIHIPQSRTFTSYLQTHLDNKNSRQRTPMWLRSTILDRNSCLGLQKCILLCHWALHYLLFSFFLSFPFSLTSFHFLHSASPSLSLLSPAVSYIDVFDTYVLMIWCIIFFRSEHSIKQIHM